MLKSHKDMTSLLRLGPQYFPQNISARTLNTKARAMAAVRAVARARAATRARTRARARTARARTARARTAAEAARTRPSSPHPSLEELVAEAEELAAAWAAERAEAAEEARPSSPHPSLEELVAEAEEFAAAWAAERAEEAEEAEEARPASPPPSLEEMTAGVEAVWRRVMSLVPSATDYTARRRWLNAMSRVEQVKARLAAQARWSKVRSRGTPRATRARLRERARARADEVTAMAAARADEVTAMAAARADEVTAMAATLPQNEAGVEEDTAVNNDAHIVSLIRAARAVYSVTNDNVGAVARLAMERKHTAAAEMRERAATAAERRQANGANAGHTKHRRRGQNCDGRFCSSKKKRKSRHGSKARSGRAHKRIITEKQSKKHNITKHRKKYI